MKNFLHRMDSMLNCIIHSLKEVHKSRSIALKITESLKRNKALSEENLTTPFEYARKHAGNNPDRSAFITLRGQKKAYVTMQGNIRSISIA